MPGIRVFATLCGVSGSGGAGAEPPVARELPDGTVTFVMTDVVGSTELWEQAPR